MESARGAAGPFDAPLITVSVGLDKVIPVRGGYVEARAGWDSSAGPVGRLEGGLLLTPRSGLFAFAEADSWGQRLGGGWRYTW